jgi:branched-chain amino acid transport system ATP-binding protein
MFELRHIWAGYDGSTVLRDVSICVPPHSVVALLGANGAGKTTLLRVAAGLLEVDSGQVILNDADVTGQQPHARAQAGLCLIPEGRGVFPDLSVRENLRLQCAPELEPELDDRVADAFPRLGQRMSQRAGTLSGGEQQMLSLARCHLTQANIVLLDEVSMGLAPLIVDEIFEFIHRLRSSGVALLIVEQYVQRALEIANYAYVLNRGEMTFVGEPGEIGQSGVLESYLG